MINRRQKQYECAFDLLTAIRLNYPAVLETYPDNASLLQPLLSLQKLLIREISRAERKIQRSKSILKTIDATQLPERAAGLDERIEEYRHLAYQWRCFGDGIAFLFMDKYALKQTLYQTDSLSPKQDAGFLIGKVGLKQELQNLESFLNQGIPALLNDLTNTIRHGDICVLFGPDPILQEVKSGKLDRRGKRQQRSIKKLKEFFESDTAEGLRGFEKITRVSFEKPEVVHSEAMNRCVAEAFKNGFGTVSPETGLHYIALIDSDAELPDIVGKLNLKNPMVFMLNEAKSNRVWSPYYPFTLLLNDGTALHEFIWGGLVLVVVFEMDVTKEYEISLGIKIEYMPDDPDYAFLLAFPDGEGQMNLSRQMFTRIALDCTSPKWLFDFAMELLEAQAQQEAPQEDATGSQKVLP